MKQNIILETIYKMSKNYDVILKGHTIINEDTNVILFAHYCSSELFYKDFFRITKNTFYVNNLAKRNLKQAKSILKKLGYKKIWTKGVFSFYGDLRPLAVEVGFGEWGKNGIIVNEIYGSDFLISAIFYK